MIQDFRSEIMSFLENIQEKINEKIKPTALSVIDNSHLHTKHRSFNPEKFHIKLIIKSEKLKNMEKIEAHKLIFSILKEEMQNKIHALEIEIN